MAWQSGAQYSPQARLFRERDACYDFASAQFSPTPTSTASGGSRSYAPHISARTIEQAARDGYVTSLLGRRRPVPEIRASNRATRSLGERYAVNFVMQGSNADIIKVAMIRIARRLRDEGRTARMVLQVHDELLLEVPDAEVTAVRELVRAEMCGAYVLDPPLAVDVGVGENWAEAKS